MYCCYLHMMIVELLHRLDLAVPYSILDGRGLLMFSHLPGIPYQLTY